MRAPALALAAAAFVACGTSGNPAGPGDGGAAEAAADAGLPPCTSPEFEGSPLAVHCNALVDAQGRTVLLHGLNARVAGVFDVTFTDGRAPLQTIPVFGAADAARIRQLGFDALRLAVNWSGIEPNDGAGFVESYLDQVAAVVDACRAADVLVLVDFHQDDYSKEIGEDGAPYWAIQPPPSMVHGGPLGPLNPMPPDVINAYQTFFGTSAEGATLRARFAAMAAHVAARFAGDDHVLGFELYNEPLTDEADLLAFDQQILQAIRGAAPNKLVLFEPVVTRNEVDVAPIGQGSLGAGTVYAPHVYTFAFTGDPATFMNLTKEELERSNDSARAEADGWQAPLVITEWGFDPGNVAYANYVRWQQELQDQNLASAFYWLWKEYGTGSWGFYDFDADAGALAGGTERAAVVAAMSRVRLERAAGRLVSVAYDEGAKAFTATFVGDAAVTAPNVVSIGATAGFASFAATCDGAPVQTTGASLVSLPCGGPGVHTIALSAR
jgi:endoglycosylceramidase